MISLSNFGSITAVDEPFVFTSEALPSPSTPKTSLVAARSDNRRLVGRAALMRGQSKVIIQNRKNGHNCDISIAERLNSEAEVIRVNTAVIYSGEGTRFALGIGTTRNLAGFTGL